MLLISFVYIEELYDYKVPTDGEYYFSLCPSEYELHMMCCTLSSLCLLEYSNIVYVV